MYSISQMLLAYFRVFKLVYFVLIITNNMQLYSTDILVVTTSNYKITMDLHTIMFKVHCIALLNILYNVMYFVY